jgi:signal transduction histidine kinase
VVSVLLISNDITDRKQAEEERERLLKSLEEKTKELEQVLYAASHDLRSPLVNIQGFAREMEQSVEQVRSVLKIEDIPNTVREQLSAPLNEDIPSALQYIHASAYKIDSLLGGLLQLSRLGRDELDIKRLNMNKLMESVIHTFEYSIRERGVKLEVGHLPPCLGDETRINQLFSNLIDNALKFLDPNRPGIIKINGTKEDKQAVYCVEDNGIGIAPEYHEKVFEIFERLNPTACSGEGLGLTIVRMIADRHNGRIWLHSEPGKGSRFFVSLPARLENHGKEHKDV